MGAYGASWQHRRCSLIKPELGITCPASLTGTWREVSPDPVHPRCCPRQCRGGSPAGVALGQAGAHSWSIFPGNSTGFVSSVATPRPCHQAGGDNPKLPGHGESLHPSQPDSNHPILGFVGAAPRPHRALTLLSSTPLRGRVTAVPAILP